MTPVLPGPLSLDGSVLKSSTKCSQRKCDFPFQWSFNNSADYIRVPPSRVVVVNGTRFRIQYRLIMNYSAPIYEHVFNTFLVLPVPRVKWRRSV